MPQGDNMEVFGELMRREPNLLARPIEELVPISFIGGAAVSAYRALVSQMGNLGLTEEQQAKTLKDGQDAGKMLLAIQARIGELLPTSEEAQWGGRGGRERVLPSSLGETANARSRRARTARTIANNPDVVEEVIRDAEENEDIPTRGQVVERVRRRQAEERERRVREEAERRGINDQSAISAAPFAVQTYLSKMEHALARLPRASEVPADGWNEETMRIATGYATAFVHRLGRFLDAEVVAFSTQTMERLGFDDEGVEG
jgi:hypothetical protein